MSNIKQAEELLHKEIAVLEGQIEKLKAVIEVLGDNMEAKEVPIEQPAVMVNVVEEFDDVEELRKQFVDYPVEGKHRDKVRFILTRYNRAISEAEFEKIIRLMEGENAQGTLDVFERTLRGMTHPKFGEILHFNFVNNKTRFYIVPNWRTEDKTQVLQEKMPIANDCNNLDALTLTNPTFKFKNVN